MDGKRPLVFIYGLNKDHYIAELIKAAASEDPMYRCVAAAAEDTPRQFLKTLCMDSNSLVRRCAANNAATPPKYAARAAEETGGKEDGKAVVIRFERKKKAYYATLF